MRSRIHLLPARGWSKRSAWAALLAVMLAAFSAIVLLPGILHRPLSCGWYTVAPGDALNRLAETYHTDVGTLAAANDLARPYALYTGQRLCIPGGIASAAALPPGYVQGEPAFVAFATPYARRAHDATGWSVSVILAQWGVEHGWKLPGFTGYNWGNVAAIVGEPTVPGTHAWGSPTQFAYAATPEDGLRYYVRVAHLDYYRQVAAAARTGPDAAARALGASPWDAGHYTSEDSPGSTLLAVMTRYNLYTYDDDTPSVGPRHGGAPGTGQ